MIRKDYLRMKLTVPQVLHTLLPRKNIADIMDSISLDEAVCMVAPYGYGKTLAAVSWLRERGFKAAWFSLDETDNSETAFLAGLSAAILRNAGWQGDTDDILSDVKFISDQQAFLWEAISFAEQYNEDNRLVLDGLQFITDTGLLIIIKNIISTILGGWRVIITSRAELPSIFNELILRRRIYLITIKELCFSPEEIGDFFSLNGCPASWHDILSINEETEGWPVSMNVVLMLSRGGPVIYSRAAREYIAEFFETEVWHHLSESVKEFLLKTSILDRLTPAACNSVTDMGATLPTLRWLYVNGLFISRLNENEAFRYHRVFQNFLRNKLSSSGIDEHGLYKKIAWRMFERDEFEQALTYFFKAGDLYGLSRVFRVINPADIGIERYLELTSCILSLNIDDLRNYPLIIAKMALNHFALGNMDEMWRLYVIFLDLIKPGKLPLPPEEYAECIWEAGWLSYLNPSEPILSNSRHEDWFNYTEYSPLIKSHHYARAAIYRFPSIMRGIRDYCPVLNILEEYIQENKEYGYHKIDDEVSLWRLDMVRAEYAYELEDFSTAEKLIRSIMSEVERENNTDLYFVCIALLVRITRAVRGSNGISALTSRLEKMIHKNGHTVLLPRFHAFELRNRLIDGFTGQTREFEEENKDYMDKPYFYLLYRHMTLVRALLSTGDFYEAAMLLGNLEHLCHEYNRIMDLIEVNILKSVVDYGMGYEDGARDYLEEALNMAREYGFIRIFSDDAKLIWPVLDMISADTKDPYIKNIIISCKKTLARSGGKLPRKKQLNGGLTKTELKILKTLQSNMSYKEIAFDNQIKISTVKTHIHSIYSKLEVENRTAAVIAARDMGILE